VVCIALIGSLELLVVVTGELDVGMEGEGLR
jgi:hypothetical protein